MSNRFHSKYHRQNHHTYTNDFNPDAGHDPIASREQPFRGDFVLAGALSAYAPLSATAGYFYSNNTALCAFAGRRGLHVHSGGTTDNFGIYVFSSGIGLSALANTVGINVYAQQHGIDVYGTSNAIRSYSPGNGITSYGGTYAGMFTSPSRAVSASGGTFAYQGYSPSFGMFLYGGIYGATIQSPTRAISAFGGAVGLDVFSPIRGINVIAHDEAINAISNNRGIVVRAPTIALSSGGGGVNIFNNKVGIFKSPTDYPKAGGIVLDVNGNAYITGDITVTGDISASGVFSYFDTKVTITSSLRVLNIGTDAAATISQTGNYPVLACYDADVSTTIPSFIVDGANKGWVGLGVESPKSPLNIVKNNSDSNGQPQILIVDEGTDPFTRRVLGLGVSTNTQAQPTIGTFSENHLLFATNSSTKMRILSSGRVGINVSFTDTFSSSQLDVGGAVTVRGETLNLFDVQTENLSGVYLHLPAVPFSVGNVEPAGYGDFALIRQIGDRGNAGGSFYGNYHLALDLHNDANVNNNLNQQFSIRNVASDGSGTDTITNRVRIDGGGNVFINTPDEQIVTIASPAKLTINGSISSNNNLTVRGNATFSQGMNVLGNVTSTGASFGNTNLITGSIADSRYQQLSAFYKNGESVYQVTSNVNWTDADMYLDLQNGVYIIDVLVYTLMGIAAPTLAQLGVKLRFNYSNTPANQKITLQSKGSASSAHSVVYNSSLPADTNVSILASQPAANIIDSRGVVEIVNPGRLSLQIRNNDAGTQNITVGKHSYIRATKIS